MPCQCNATAALAPEGAGACECGIAPDSAGACECGAGTPTPSDRGTSLERVVMELDKRVRALETSAR